MSETNWAGNLIYQAEAVRFPQSVAEVQELVAGLPRVRGLGTRHSFSTVADSPGGELISLSAIVPEITIDPAASTVTVSAGASYGVLAAELQRHGYALDNMGSLPHISVAGATATGTHGSGDSNGILSTAIRAVELITADGSLVAVDRSNPDLAAVAVGLGAFGIIVRVTLDIGPSFFARQDVYRGAPWGVVVGSLDEVMASAYSVSLMTDFASPAFGAIWQKAITEPDADPADAPQSLYGGTWDDDAGLPAGHNLNPRAGTPGPWSERIPHFPLDSEPSAGGDELQSEYFVDRRHGAAALEALRALGSRISPHLRTAEIRTVAADELWMSPAYRRNSLCIGFTWHKHPPEVAALLPDIETALAPYEPRPHWGKLYAFDAVDLSARFPRLRDYLELVDTYDPDGKFSNPFLRRIDFRI